MSHKNVRKFIQGHQNSYKPDDIKGFKKEKTLLPIFVHIKRKKQIDRHVKLNKKV